MSFDNTRKENKMGTMPVGKLLITMSLPMIISMLVQAMYNVVDSIYVSRLGENALAAVSLAFPIQQLMISVASGTGVGINALLSKSLGQKNYDRANKTATNGLILALISCLVFTVFGLFFSESYFVMQTNIPEIVKYGKDYLFFCCTFCFGIFFSITGERLLQSTGRTFYNMISQTTGALINIILDPILIFGMFGFPRMEVAGAAIATIIGQIAGMSISMFCNITKNKDIDLSPKNFVMQLPIIKEIYRVGIPSILMMSIGSVMTFCINKILLFFSATAVSIFGVYFKLQSFIFMPVFGLNNGVVPIIAYNYGARKPDRIMKALKIGTGIAFGIMVFGFCLFQFAPNVLLSFFDASEEMLSMGIPALRIISFSFLFAGICIALGSTFQAMGNGMYSLAVSVCRQIIVLIPCAFILSKIMGVNGVWLAFPIAEIMSITISLILFFRIYNNKIKPLYQPEEETEALS